MTLVFIIRYNRSRHYGPAAIVPIDGRDKVREPERGHQFLLALLTITLDQGHAQRGQCDQIRARVPAHVASPASPRGRRSPPRAKYSTTPIFVCEQNHGRRAGGPIAANAEERTCASIATGTLALNRASVSCWGSVAHKKLQQRARATRHPCEVGSKKGLFRPIGAGRGARRSSGARSPRRSSGARRRNA